jgi:catechol 2,3-dioxygenase-like lactoylglutathione lyase family enzyme
MFQSIEIILYVADQSRSREFYRATLGIDPTLDVPGMTEFELAPGTKLGIMPETGIARILGDRSPHPATGNGIPRCEVYLRVEDPNRFLAQALAAGARDVSPLSERDWGDRAGYVADPDGHIVAFASPLG